MSRSGYYDDVEDNWTHIMWRGRVASSTRGKRGQALLRDLLEALDAMHEKRLIPHDLKNECGVCALGALAERRGMQIDGVDPEDAESVASLFDVATPLAREIVFMNDEGVWANTPEERWTHMRDWVASQIKAEAA